MNFVPLREATARALMRARLRNFLERMAAALAISLDEARTLARTILSEPSDGDDANGSDAAP